MILMTEMGTIMMAKDTELVHITILKMEIMEITEITVIMVITETTEIMVIMETTEIEVMVTVVKEAEEIEIEMEMWMVRMNQATKL